MAAACGEADDGSVSAPPEAELVAENEIATELAAESDGFTPETIDDAPPPAPPEEPLDTSGWLLEPPFYAAGDEPFWQLSTFDGWFVFQRLGLAEIDAPIFQPESDGGAQIFETDPIILRLERGACRLATASASSSVSASVVFDGVEYLGCAFAGAPPGEAVADTSPVWTDGLATSLAPIDACVTAFEAASGGEASAITALYPREGNLTAVVFQSATGRLSECGAPSSGGDIVFLDPIEPGDADDWMVGDIRFLRADNMPPPENCPDAEPVFGRGDNLIGYYLSPECRL